VGENAQLREVIARATDSRFVMVGSSAGLQKVRALVNRVAPTNARVLITGENGTGKELVARAIHDGSARKRAPFVEVNCAAIPAELAESELFGHVEGSFTGASRDQEGKFEAADGGTLFLDEIGDLALNAQAKILRALQEGVIVRVGDSTSRPVNVRVIAATNRDLTTEIAAERFREDLYHRLNVMPIRLPPLRDRLGDLAALVSHFVDVLGAGPGMSRKTFSEGALRRLRARRWPGNVRELRNAVERLLILAGGDEVTEVDIETFLPPDGGTPIDKVKLVAGAADRSYQAFRDEVERAFLVARLRDHRGNVSEMARALKIQRKNLQAKLTKFGIEKERQ
jgi:two-component system nitrogen regulation response regulator NtrX